MKKKRENTTIFKILIISQAILAIILTIMGFQISYKVEQRDEVKNLAKTAQILYKR